ncbi:MAG: hypothetical protein KIT80_18365 [Chitinophagaceae bacterium]|nr:hypothetical protein [Chitinophagaceae bacterium]MCW5928890.1 hypothetical protein [Chitinophagaceae bacterium]
MLLKDDPVSHGYAYLSGISVSGDLRRPMEPGSTRTATAATGGYKAIAGWGFKGHFDYKKTFDKALAWSNVHHAYEGNPFLWADSNIGKWLRDEVNAAVAIAAPAIGRQLNVGLGIDYTIGSGARTNEPKPFYRIRDLSLQPSIYWQPSYGNNLGITGLFSFVQEENEIGQYSHDNVLLFRLRGYGTFSKSPMVSGARRRSGHVAGMGIHYDRDRGTYRILAGGRFSARLENVFEGTAVRSVTGDYTAYAWQAYGKLHTGNSTRGSLLAITFESINGYADDHVYQAENASHTTRDIRIDMSRWFHYRNNMLLQWTAAPFLSYRRISDYATRTAFDVQQAGAELSLNNRIPLRQYLVLGLCPSVNGSFVINDQWHHTMPNTITKYLVLPDYRYFTTNRFRGSIKTELEYHAKNNTIHAISLFASLVSALNSDLKRTNYELQYSIFF